MILILQIALGIVLAILILNFLPEILRLGLTLFALAIPVLLYFIFQILFPDNNKNEFLNVLKDLFIYFALPILILYLFYYILNKSINSIVDKIKNLPIITRHFLSIIILILIPLYISTLGIFKYAEYLSKCDWIWKNDRWFELAFSLPIPILFVYLGLSHIFESRLKMAIITPIIFYTFYYFIFISFDYSKSVYVLKEIGRVALINCLGFGWLIFLWLTCKDDNITRIVLGKTLKEKNKQS